MSKLAAVHLLIAYPKAHGPSPMDLPSLSTDASLLRRLRDPADESAWRTFHKRYREPLHSWCRRWYHPRTPDADTAAEDTVQDVLTSLISSLQRFDYDQKGSFRGWLKTVAWNACRTAARKRWERRADNMDLSCLESAPARLDFEERLQIAFDLEVYEEACQRVRRRIVDNPQGNPKTWEAFRLTVSPALGGEGLNNADAAERLAVRPDFVATARKNIKRMLEAEVAVLDPPD